MSANYPSDYHPLAPILRQLRGAITWLDDSGVKLDQAHIQSLLQRVSALPQLKVKDQRTLQISHYWSSLPQLNPHIVNEAYTDDDQCLSVEHEELQNTKGEPLHSEYFPAVLHQRSVIDSISFELSPPLDTDVEGSAELMTPSVSLLQRRGVSSLSKSAQIHNTKEAAVLSVVVPTVSTKPKTEQLWATKTVPKPIISEPNPQKIEAFTKLTITKASSPSPIHTESTPLTTSLKLAPQPHVRKTTFEIDKQFGEICDRVWGCTSCPRHQARHLIGSGHYGAQIMFVVAQPLEQDLNTGYFFMGQSQRELFNGLLKAMSLSRMEVYLTSLLKCGSEVPKPHEWAQCQNHFLDELQVVRPQIIVALGYMTSVILLGNQVRQGVWGRYQEIDIMPTFHPEDIIKGGDKLKRSFWNHLRLVMRKVGLENLES
jgi:uracil-DNA glycosylase